MRLLALLAPGLGACTSASLSREAPVLEASPSGPRAIAQLGLRIASLPSAPDLLPRSSQSWSASTTTSISAPLAALPQPMGSAARVAAAKLTPSPNALAPDAFLLAYFHAPTLPLLEVDSRASEETYKPHFTETRFVRQLPELMYERFHGAWSEEFRMVLESMPLRTPGVADPLAQTLAPDAFIEERNDSGWQRGQKTLRTAFRDGAKDSDAGAPVVDQLRDWRNQPVNLLLAVLGGSIEQDTPEGGKLILGPQISELNDAENPADLLRVRYLLGPFEARAQSREAWARYRTDLLGCSLILRTAYNYLDQDQSYQLSLSRRLHEKTELRLFGGSGLGSESLTGFSPYPEDFREDRRLAVFLVLDRRF